LHFSGLVGPDIEVEAESRVVDGRIPFCITLTPDPLDIGGMLMNEDEAAMFIEVGEIADKFHAVPTTVRLTSLEQCEVFFSDSPKLSFAPTSENLMTIFNRKLDLIADTARIALSEGTGDVIKRIAQACRKFSNSDAHLDYKIVQQILSQFTSKCSVRILGRDIRLMGLGESIPNPSQVFDCPIDLGLDFLALL
jgi:hypothetical protein